MAVDFEIHVMDADGSDPVNLTQIEYSESQPHRAMDLTSVRCVATDAAAAIPRQVVVELTR
jgi:hypothetical protein